MHTSDRTQGHPYDVVILGNGFAGALLGAILARNGVRVALVDASTHPRVSTGEYTTPYTVAVLRAMAERYRVPELKTLTTSANCNRILRPAFGVGKHIGFATHHEGQPHDPGESVRFRTTANGTAPAHWYRADVDAYLYHTAVRYGCVSLHHRVTDVRVDASGVTVGDGDGAEVRARYLVDASGPAAPLAAALGLREDPCRFQHHARTVWSHLLDVPAADTLLGGGTRGMAPSVTWHQGATHHVFEGGYIWVVPFDNDRSSGSGLCSVGLVLDARRYPQAEGVEPEGEFYEHAARFPSVLRQLSGTRAARTWAATPPQQYSCAKTVGDRWCLLGTSAGYVDPLLGMDVTVDADAVNMIAWRLLRAVADDDFSASRFETVERRQQAVLDGNDAVASSLFAAFGDHRLSSAVLRILAAGALRGTGRVQVAGEAYLTDRSDEHFRRLEETFEKGGWRDEAYVKVFDEVVARCEAYRTGVTGAGEAAEDLQRALEAGEIATPETGLAVPGRRMYDLVPATSRGSTQRRPLAAATLRRGVTRVLRIVQGQTETEGSSS